MDDEDEHNLTEAMDNIIQKQVLSATNLVTTNPGSSFQELSSAFRLSITPKFSNSLIFLEYFIPLNQTTTGHNNIFGFSFDVICNVNYNSIFYQNVFYFEI